MNIFFNGEIVGGRGGGKGKGERGKKRIGREKMRGEGREGKGDFLLKSLRLIFIGALQLALVLLYPQTDLLYCLGR